MAKKLIPADKVTTAEVRQVRHPIKAAALLYSAPGFILRGPIYVMFISLISMFIYACIATTDTLVTAPLKLQRQTVTVQAIGGGLIETIDVKENDVVYGAGVGRESTLIATIQEKIRAASTPEQEAIKRQIDDIETRKASALRDYEYRKNQLQSQIDEINKKQASGKDSITYRIGQLENQLAANKRTITSIEQDIALAVQKRDQMEPLCARRDVPITQCEQLRQRVIDLNRAHNDAKTTLDNTTLSLKTAQNEQNQLNDPNTMDRMLRDLAKLDSDFKNQSGEFGKQIADLERRIRESSTLVSGVTYDGDRAIYRATVDEGIVTTVHVQRGQLIDAGKPIATIVKTNAPLMARVLVQNKDIGHLAIGQKVQIKYFAYPFQEYGIQEGSIDNISPRPSTQPGEESLYVVDVTLASETVRRQGSGIQKHLEIGLQGMAEIKTGEQHFIEILFAPARKFFQAGQEKASAPEASAPSNP